MLDDNTHPSAFFYLNKENVFNVCITRARVQQNNFISFSLKKLNNYSLLGSYLGHVNNPMLTDQQSKDIEEMEEFMREVLDSLSLFELDKILVGYEMAGVRLDLLVVKNNRSYGIDLIGYSGEYEDILSISAWKMINRIGIPIFYLPYSSWVFNRGKTLNAIKDFIGA